MAIKILIKRKFKAGSLKQATQLLIRARYAAMGRKGYISSETLSDLRDPNKIIVVSMWHGIEDWNDWKNSPARAEFEAEMAKLVTGPAEIETFGLGVREEA
jgi:heme-degrading monooxygenase HmoA